MESEEGDVSQPVLDNGSDGETGCEAVDTCMDIQAPKCLKGKNRLWNQAESIPASCLGWEQRQVPKRKFEIRAATETCKCLNHHLWN